VNKNLMQVTHEASRSILRPLSSGNTRHQAAKEGLNGSVLIDETHVVDREFVAILSRAGISRSEPLQVEVSTAGNDPEGYGHERFELAERVIKGQYEGNDQEHVFAAIYAAPQDLADAELAKDPLKWGRLANPAMGHTVDPEEYLADYRASKDNLLHLALFKMYRLNVWQRATTPWLDMLAWDGCKRDFTEDDLVGRPCAAALDLAKTRDTCALALVFWDASTDTYQQIVYYWLPEKRADVLRDKVGYLAWARAGWINLIPGDTIDFRIVRQAVAAAKERFGIGRLTYDDHYAEQLVQALIEEDGAFLLDQVTSFPQTVSAFAGPTDDYEAAILAGTLHHNGNPVLTWQAGNCRVKLDANHNKRPVKQKHGDSRTIDGIVAGIMAKSQMELVKAGSVYDDRGVLTI
jgi:phage terminase large subunit-like protein